MKIKCKICKKEIERTGKNQKYCKECMIIIERQHSKTFRENNKEYYKNYKKKWYQKNKERLNKKNKEYIQKYPEKSKRYSKKYYEKNKNNPLFIKKLRCWSNSWKERNKENIKEKRRSEEFKKINREYKIKERKKYPERIKSRRIANNNIPIEFGKLCELCKINLAIERHHENYLKPLEVMFLCHQCHGIKHRKDSPILEAGTLETHK